MAYILIHSIFIYSLVSSLIEYLIKLLCPGEWVLFVEPSGHSHDLLELFILQEHKNYIISKINYMLRIHCLVHAYK